MPPHLPIDGHLRLRPDFPPVASHASGSAIARRPCPRLTPTPHPVLPSPLGQAVPHAGRRRLRLAARDRAPDGREPARPRRPLEHRDDAGGAGSPCRRATSRGDPHDGTARAREGPGDRPLAGGRTRGAHDGRAVCPDGGRRSSDALTSRYSTVANACHTALPPSSPFTRTHSSASPGASEPNHVRVTAPSTTSYSVASKPPFVV